MKESRNSEPLDRLLAQALRASRTGGVCPEAEQLAAFVEHALDVRETTQVEHHVADCARCAAVVSALLDAEPTTAASLPWWQTWGVWRWAVPMATAALVAGVWFASTRPREESQRDDKPMVMASREVIPDSIPNRAQDTGAVPPAGVVAPEAKANAEPGSAIHPTLTPSARSEPVAPSGQGQADRPAKGALAETVSLASGVSPGQSGQQSLPGFNSHTAEQAPTGNTAPQVKAEAPTVTASQRQVLSGEDLRDLPRRDASPAAGAPAAAPAPAPAGAAQNGQELSFTLSGTLAESTRADAAAAAARGSAATAAESGRTETQAAASPASVPAAPAQARGGGGGGGRGGRGGGRAGGASSAGAAAVAGSGNGFGPGPSTEELQQGRVLVDGMAVQTFAPIVLRNGAGTAQWRVQGIAVDRSTDGGATWSRVYTAPRPLTAGAAAADDTLWLVGQGGLIVRSTAAGWALAVAPAVVDLTAVSQVTRLGATVRTNDGRTFRTENGGSNWVQGN